MSRTKQEKNKALVLEADLLRLSVNREIQSRIVEHGFVSQGADFVRSAGAVCDADAAGQDSLNLHLDVADRLLARATVWAGETTAAQNQIFNVTNGDTQRWQHMWPRIAKMFDMDVADPVPFSLTTYMADKRPMWDAIVKRENLRPIPYEQIVAWGYGDFAFRQDFDNVSSTIKVRQAGFHDCIDSETMFSEIYENLREMRILPRLPGSVSVNIPTREVSTFDSQRRVS